VIPVRPTAAATAPAKKTVPKSAPSSAPSGPVVLVAHDSEMVRETICSVLLEAGFGVDTASDGVAALKKAFENKPQALVLDVGLPGIYGFELCERLKGNQETAGIKIILLSSVYDMRRYKRTPVNLYGADDYIEKHHIPDFLPVKLKKLLFPDKDEAAAARPAGLPKSELPEMARPPAREFQPSMLAQHASRPSSPAQSDQTQQAEGPEASDVLPESFSLDASIFQKEECDIPKVEAADPAAVEKAKRFARIIVSDIALYNQETVIEGLKNGTFFELLKGDVEEGREIYNNRVPEKIRVQKDYYQEAFDNFIRAAKKNVR
jgi:DNA-binding response OmpR family regulator